MCGRQAVTIYMQCWVSGVAETASLDARWQLKQTVPMQVPFVVRQSTHEDLSDKNGEVIVRIMDAT